MKEKYSQQQVGRKKSEVAEADIQENWVEPHKREKRPIEMLS